jgi:hypothetical protein
MEKFTKTTEIDISAMNEIEDEAPKKSNVGNVIAIIVCLLFAILIWVFVIETDDSLTSKVYKVNVTDTVDGYEIVNTSINVEIRATRSDLADLSKDEIIVMIDKTALNKEIDTQKLPVKVHIESSDEGEWIVVSNNLSVQVSKK